MRDNTRYRKRENTHIGSNYKNFKSAFKATGLKQEQVLENRKKY